MDGHIINSMLHYMTAWTIITYYEYYELIVVCIGSHNVLEVPVNH